VPWPEVSELWSVGDEPERSAQHGDGVQAGGLRQTRPPSLRLSSPFGLEEPLRLEHVPTTRPTNWIPLSIATFSLRPLATRLIVPLVAVLSDPSAAQTVTAVFFDRSQTTNLVASGTTSDTIRSEGYLFTFTRDEPFTGGMGLSNPIGRAVRIP